MEGTKQPAIALTNKERFPLIGDLSYLNKLKQDEFAPKFNFESGDRLGDDHLKQVHEYSRKVRAGGFWNNKTQRASLDDFMKWCIETVPFYRGRNNVFEAQPTIRRKDLYDVPWHFVSDDCYLDDLLVGSTSGTSGPSMNVIVSPVSQACWIPQLESILERHEIRLTKGKDITSIALIGNQSRMLTYASLSTYLEGAGVLKVNLNASDWKDARDRVRYLEKYNPEILTGDPFAFTALMELKPKLSPRAIVSSAMKLTQGVRTKLEAYFKCPVLDIYSLTECRMVAVADAEGRYRAIRPELYLEVFDREKDIPLKPGERGELVITGGNNPFLPLIRYRTGDFCSLAIENGVPYLVDLEGRSPVSYYRRDGSFVNYIEISRAMKEHPLAGFRVHQEADKSVQFTGWATDGGLESLVRRDLERIFGNDLLIDIAMEQPGSMEGKPVSYTSNL
jgi:phenylacetate-CoA ligase